METLNKNGVSITQTPGEEKYVKCCLSAFRGQTNYQYDYRHTNENLFSTVAKILEICRQKQDECINAENNRQFTFYFKQTYTKPNRAGFALAFTPAKSELSKRQRKTTSTPIMRRSLYWDARLIILSICNLHWVKLPPSYFLSHIGSRKKIAKKPIKTTINHHLYLQLH
mgnify:CR=1 FL=1|jgi:hypothetical protein